jgi:hypothetical protein
MFEEYSCGCILSCYQGRVRICRAHRNIVEHDGKKWTVLRFDPSGKIVCRYPANGKK